LEMLYSKIWALFTHSDPLAISNQLDGAADTSDEDASDVSDDNIDDDDDDDDLDQENDDLVLDGGAEEEPLNSEDDVTDEDAADLFDTDNVIVCQYDKVSCLMHFS
jgi:transcription initiation factor TFIIA large subunit